MTEAKRTATLFEWAERIEALKAEAMRDGVDFHIDYCCCSDNKYMIGRDGMELQV